MKNIKKQINPKDESVKKTIPEEYVLVKMGNYSFYADLKTAKMVKEGMSILEDYLNEKNE
jgi:hypothetical protein